MRKLLAGSALVYLCSAGFVHAQDATRWGVTGSFVPTWTVPDQLSILLPGDQFELRGSEFRIGVARGRELGGDWSVSFVRKRFTQDSYVAKSESFQECSFTANGSSCREGLEGFRFGLDSVTLTGVQFERFRPFATIKKRVQIGLTYGGGVGQLSGRAKGITFGSEGTKTEERPVNQLVSDDDGDVGLIGVPGVGPLKAVPLAKFEATVAGLVAPGLKIRASGGFNFPGYQVGSISLVYFFGSR